VKNNQLNKKIKHRRKSGGVVEEEGDHPFLLREGEFACEEIQLEQQQLQQQQQVPPLQLFLPLPPSLPPLPLHHQPPLPFPLESKENSFVPSSHCKTAEWSQYGVSDWSTVQLTIIVEVSAALIAEGPNG